jgi:lipopolysaccharide export system protein LptC
MNSQHGLCVPNKVKCRQMVIKCGYLVTRRYRGKLLFNKKKPLKIISRNVWVRLDTGYAETAAPTTILFNNSETHSIGMRVLMPTEQIDLLSQVRGHYVLP